ncbi:MAG TPA: cation transporter [Acidobacteriaceae bacterium]|nr:cation transporter [Acidobacteriaceae bacterium]
MEQAAAYPANGHASAVRRLQLITIGWMLFELGVSLYAGIRACSIALTAFGVDSAIELISALVVLRRFTLGPSAERRSAHLSGVLLYILAAYILVSSALVLSNKHFQAEPTALGIALLVAAAIIMPLLGRAKKRIAAKTDSGALNADAAQSNICAYMSWIALAGLVVNFSFHLPWADSLAALILLPIVLTEAKEALKGAVCEDC